MTHPPLWYIIDYLSNECFLSSVMLTWIHKKTVASGVNCSGPDLLYNCRKTENTPFIT